MQKRIIEALRVKPSIDIVDEVTRRVDAIANYVKIWRANSLVLGISGGVDSTTAGRLCQLAVEKLRDDGVQATFIAVRLPYKDQRDESDAQAALDFIKPDRIITANIRAATDAIMFEICTQVGYNDEAHEDFVAGNVKARQRMIVQYAIAGTTGGLVVGTDHAAENVMGFYTKFGDGAADILPLACLNKRQVRSIAKHLGAPEALFNKAATADLETLRPGLLDEEAHGVPYDEIDDFLEGKVVPSQDKIIQTWTSTMHKRLLPIELV